MKKLIVLSLSILVLIMTGCLRQAAPSGGSSPAQTAHNQVTVALSFHRRSGIATNQFAVWIEDNEGKYIKTLFATRFVAGGGWKSRPDAVPGWVQKSGISAGSKTDTRSGATPQTGRLTYVWDCTDEKGQAVPAGDYRFVVGGTIFWKDAVTYSGTIRVGGGEASAEAVASFTTDTAKQSDMITDVRAVYKP